MLNCFLVQAKPIVVTTRTRHPAGSRWRNSDCMDCDCLECCQGYMTPVDFPDDCMKEWDQKACEFKVVKKRDPSISCPIFASVGK
uniref:Uncharacterized protein n=1 Tax=Oncorhynchus kisutch TaxID=8019 RepID=A0A8C7CV98_ONCKI